ncbi:MAG: UDP-N-acetylglucosamine 4,6-dehydratase (inverting) [Candidatus Micrarchaeia archaeon]
MELDGKTILLTGGTGSFGQKFTEIVLKKYNPASVRIYSRGEHKQVEMERKFNDDRLRFFVGDVRDKARLYRAMNGVDIVVHAAALKHVPVCEYNPIEAVRTNIEGAINVVDAAIDNEVEKVVAISTDKAVQPVNLYGTTKLAAEKIFIQANAYSGKRRTRFSCVRYGNVVGSNGSVIPLFLKQREAGEITITDERMTRFWITLEQGVELVLRCIREMKGGEIFVPKIPSVKITDLADVMAPNAKRKIIGIRPGEKLHEMLISVDEARHTILKEDYFIIEPEFSFWVSESHEKHKHLPDGFYYSSDNNEWWLKGNELKEFLKKEGWL